MSKEEVKTVETEAEEVITDAEPTEPEKDEEGEAGKDTSSSQIDYQALLDEERERANKAEAALASDRFNASERKRKEKVEEPEEDEDKPLTRKELQSVLLETQRQSQRDTQASQIKEIASDLAESPEEAAYIVEIHKNRSFPPALSLKEQLEEAHFIANGKKLISTNSELKRALKGKGTASKDTASTHRDPMPGTTPKVSAQDAESYRRAGFTFDVKDRLYKKKLPSGKFLIKDPRTKQTRIV